jgi:integrase
MLGFLFGCGLRRSEVVALRLDQLQLRDSHWVIVDLVGNGADGYERCQCRIGARGL